METIERLGAAAGITTHDSSALAEKEAAEVQQIIKELESEHAEPGTDDNDSMSEESGGGLMTMSNISQKLKLVDDDIFVDKDFKPEPGVKLAPGIVIHRRLAGGWQGSIFELVDEEGVVRQDIVLKMLKPGVLLGDLEKEWAIGVALNVLQRPDGYLPGFMKTLQAVRISNKQQTFRGMLLERINGQTAQKALTDKHFRDIHYVRDMCYQVFRAMDVAYTVLGFHHTDLRLPNVMEHYPDPQDKSKREFKIIDFGLAYLERRKGSNVFKALTKAVFKRVKNPNALAKTFAATLNPINYLSKGVAVGYRAFWAGRQDVYHYLTSLAAPMDGRVWPKKDKDAVKQFMSLLDTVASVQIKAYWADEDEEGNLIMPKAGFLGKLLFRKDKALAYPLQLTKLQLQALPRPDNHGRMSPLKALKFPFFTPCVAAETASIGADLALRLESSQVPVWRSQWWTPDAVTSYSSSHKPTVSQLGANPGLVSHLLSTTSAASMGSVTSMANSSSTMTKVLQSVEELSEKASIAGDEEKPDEKAGGEEKVGEKVAEEEKAGSGVETVVVSAILVEGNGVTAHLKEVAEDEVANAESA